MCSAKMPANIITSSTSSATIPAGCLMQKSTSGLPSQDGRFVGRTVVSVMAASTVTDARIERGIDEVDDEIGHDVERREQHHHALDQREVMPRHALHEQLAE